MRFDKRFQRLFTTIVEKRSISGVSPLFWVGVLAGLGTVCAVVALVLTLRVPSLHDLASEVRALNRDITDLDDRVEKWRGRDSSRRMRAGMDAVAAQGPKRGTPEYKAYLRRRANGAPA